MSVSSLHAIAGPVGHPEPAYTAIFESWLGEPAIVPHVWTKKVPL
jgi:hypothetical protein